MTLSKLRAFNGFLVAPGAPALALYLINLFLVSRQEALLGALILAASGYLAAVFIGLPIYFFMRKRVLVGLGSYIVIGGLVGLFFYLMFFGIWGISSYQSMPEHADALIRNSAGAGLTAIAYASVSGGLFWLIAVREKIKTSDFP